MARLALALVVSSLAFLPPAAAQVGGYSFFLDGESVEPSIRSMEGTPGAPRPGDLAAIGGFLVPLDEPGEYRFRIDREAGTLHRESALVGVRVGWRYLDDGKVLVDPTADLEADGLASLRSIVLEAWPEGIESRLAAVRADRLFLSLDEECARGEARRLPELPAGLRYVSIDESSNQGIRDFASLSALADLVYLALDTMTVEAVDARWFAGSSRLRWLDLSGERVVHPEALESLVDLRVLSLRWSKGVRDVAFARKMPGLVELDVSRSEVEDLSALSAHGAIRRILASAAAVRVLPGGRLPALERVEILSAPVAPDALAALRRENPGAGFVASWNEALRDALAGCDRIRVRSGGTCHRDRESETTLFEERNETAIARVVAALEVDEKRSGQHCMCCGEPTFEFHRGDTLVAEIGFHHGQFVRWSDGWPGDGTLAPGGALALCRWLADHGVDGPLREHEEGRAREEAARRRGEGYAALLPAETLARLRQASSAKEARGAFEETIPDPTDRVVLYFRLLGSHEGSWNQGGGLESLLTSLAGNADSAVRLAGARRAAETPEGATGVGRWLFGEGAIRKLAPADRDDLVDRVGPGALAHPREVNRRMTLHHLGAAGGARALPLLRRVLAGEIEIRALDPADEIEPGGSVRFDRSTGEVPGGTSDRAYAAFLLARLGDRESEEAIRSLAADAPESDRETLAKALAALDG